jgi:CheY-like chemotaxis protein
MLGVIAISSANLWRCANQVRMDRYSPTARSFDKKGRPAVGLEACVTMIERMDSKRVTPKILIADDDPFVLRALVDRCTRMGFDVETATNGLQALIKAGQHEPDVLIVDVHMPEVDGLSVVAYLRDIAKRPDHVIVVTGDTRQQIADTCAELDVCCIHKGRNFWAELETSLVMTYPLRAAAIERAAQLSAKIEVKQRPRVLLVDDDISIKKSFFHQFGNVGAELLYAADGAQGFWKARRHEPTVIVSDYSMPHGGAEFLLTKLRSTPETSGIPVIVQTGRRLNDTIKQRLRQRVGGQPGATRILRKSPDCSELFDALQRFCGFARGLDGEPLYQ